MSSNYSGEGEALVVQEKCNALKPFTSTTIFKSTNNFNYRIINYQNSVIGKRLLAGLFINNPYSIIASDNLLSFRFIPFVIDGVAGVVIYITGIYKKCNYCSREIQYFNPLVTNKDIVDDFSSLAIKEEEFTKLLESDSTLNKLFLNLKAKLNK